MVKRYYRLCLPGKVVDFYEISDEAALRSSLNRLWTDRAERPERYQGPYTVSVWRLYQKLDMTRELRRIVASFGTWDK